MPQRPAAGCRSRSDGKLGGLGVSLLLEGDAVIRVVLHPRQPVDDELVGLFSGQAQLSQSILQKGGGIGSGNAEAPGEIVLLGALALPVQVVVGLPSLVVANKPYIIPKTTKEILSIL